MELPPQIAKHKISIATLVMIVPMLFGTITALDSRYVHADDLKDIKREQEQAQKSQDAKWVEFRRTQLEDQIFILQMKRSQKSLSPVDDALLDRYKTQLKDLKRDNP